MTAAAARRQRGRRHGRETVPEKLDAAAEKLRNICVGKEARISQCVGEIDLVKKSILARAFRGKLGTNDPKEKSAAGLLKNSKEGY